MVGTAKIMIQGIANRFGYHVSRRDAGVDLVDPYLEQLRIAGPGARVVFEVGAADGRDCSRYLDLFPTARVFAFEPIPESFAKVAERARQSPRLTPFNVAMADAPGTATFHLSNWADASSLLKPKRTGSTFDDYQASKQEIQVRVDTIDAVCQRESVQHIDILKMDAQGAELRILAGAESMLSNGAIDIVFTEVHFMESYEGAARFDQVMSVLVGHGFHLHSLYGMNHNHKGRATWADALFVHDRVAY